MARYISILVNGGHRIDLSIVKSVIRADGTEVPRNEIEDFVNEKLNIETEEVEQLDIKCRDDYFWQRYFYSGHSPMRLVFLNFLSNNHEYLEVAFSVD